MKIAEIDRILSDEAEYILGFDSPKVGRELLQLPGPDWVDRVFEMSDRPEPALESLKSIFGHGRLAGTGYLSILPVDQGIEHSAGASFAPNPIYFDPENIVKLALEAGCSAVASTLGVLGSVSGRYAERIPFIVKINHNELLSYPNTYDQTPYARVDQAFEMGAAAVGATVFFGSAESRRQIAEVSEAFEAAHEMGMATVLWCYLRNPAFTVGGRNYESAADLTGQANYIGATIEADIIKQKQPDVMNGYRALNDAGLNFGKFDERIYTDLMSEHPIDMTRYQVLNCFAGRAGLVNSGGASTDDDLAALVRAAVINKRAGGMGLISGRKTFQKPMDEGVRLFTAIQDVYLCDEVAVA
jgi:fructose-bisphosphate aldolase, class I